MKRPESPLAFAVGLSALIATCPLHGAEIPGVPDVRVHATSATYRPAARSLVVDLRLENEGRSPIDVFLHAPVTATDNAGTSYTFRAVSGLPHCTMPRFAGCLERLNSNRFSELRLAEGATLIFQITLQVRDARVGEALNLSAAAGFRRQGVERPVFGQHNVTLLSVPIETR